MKLLPLFILLGSLLFPANADHLLLTRVVTQPDAAESFSIYNPTDSPIDLTNYYICDDEEYYKMQTEGDMAPSSSISGFTARFPSISINSGDTLHVILNSDYSGFYGEEFTPDIIMYGAENNSMLETEPGSIGFSAGKLDETSELLILFYWDDNSESLIQDVDYFLWSSLGGITEVVDKTGIGDYLDDTTLNNQLFFEESTDNYYGYSRIGIEESNELATGGNGISGHDETSENFRESWEVIELFNLGCTDPEAINFDNNAEKDNGTCYFTTISDILNGSYLGQIVITAGVISDYFDVTPYGGPHSITIAEESNGSILELTIWPNDWTIELKQFVEPPFFKKEIKVKGTVEEFEGTIQISPISVNIINLEYEFQAPEVSINSILKGNHDDKIVSCKGLLVDYFDVTVYNGPHALTIENEQGYRVELSIWPNAYDIPNSSNSYLLQPPFGQYYLSVMGSVGEYDNEKQLLISGANSITVSDTINTEGDYTEIDSAIVQILPALFVLLPIMGETLDFSYSFPNNSRVIIRIYDLSGRFITSLVDKYYSNAGTVKREEDSSAWDGRDKLGQIVAPGTYIMHMEVMNPVTGETQTDAAPIVVGVKN